MTNQQQVQCANCLTHLYSVDGGVWGVTGEICTDCQAEANQEDYDNDD